MNQHMIIERKDIVYNDNYIDVSLITYWSEGIPVQGYLAIPKDNKVYPGIIYCRGGIRKVGMVSLDRIISIAKKNVVVFAPFYRGLHKDQGRDEFGGEDRYDVYNAIRLMQSLDEVKQGPIPVIGFSRGSIMALLAAKECEGTGPVIIWGGVSDLLLTYEERVDLRRMLKRVVGHPKKEAEQYQKRSAIYWADQIKTPIFIIHGTEDIQVSKEHAVRLRDALQTAGKKVKIKWYEGYGHHLPKEFDDQALNEIMQWIQANE